MSETSRPPRIGVCGSINMDLVVRTPRLPRPGETILAHRIEEIPGGKGANQAVGAARLGAAVSLIGAVGSDAFGSRLLDQLRREQVDVSHVRPERGASGVAIVAVEESGENSILVIPGANGLVDADRVEQAESLIRGCDILVAQLEVPSDAVARFLEVARRVGKPVLLNPAPAPTTFDPRLYDVDVLCPNRGEAESLLGRRLDTLDDARTAVRDLLDRGPRAVVITLGGEGAVFGDHRGVHWRAAFPVTAVDTTAAGDAFLAAFAYRRGQNSSLAAAVEFACAAGAFSATRAGAQPSLPSLADVQQVLSTERHGGVAGP